MKNIVKATLSVSLIFSFSIANAMANDFHGYEIKTAFEQGGSLKEGGYEPPPNIGGPSRTGGGGPNPSDRPKLS